MDPSLGASWQIGLMLSCQVSLLTWAHGLHGRPRPMCPWCYRQLRVPAWLVWHELLGVSIRRNDRRVRVGWRLRRIIAGPLCEWVVLVLGWLRRGRVRAMRHRAVWCELQRQLLEAELLRFGGSWECGWAANPSVLCA